jgi:hypothetical protein
MPLRLTSRLLVVMRHAKQLTLRQFDQHLVPSHTADVLADIERLGRRVKVVELQIVDGTTDSTRSTQYRNGTVAPPHPFRRVPFALIRLPGFGITGHSSIQAHTPHTKGA